MATPIGHSLAGYALITIFKPPANHQQLRLLFLSIFMANAPDLDFLPGILVGSPALYHQGVTHSLGFALMVSLGIAGVCSLRGSSFSAIFNLCFISYLSHLVLDFFSPDGRLPYGEPLFWPLSANHFISPISVFLGVHHVRLTSAPMLVWIHGIFNIHNLWSMSLELVLIAPIILLGRRHRKRLQG